MIFGDEVTGAVGPRLWGTITGLMRWGSPRKVRGFMVGGGLGGKEGVSFGVLLL